MAYVDELVIAGEDHSVQKFIKDIRDLQPQACGAPHSRSPSRVLGSDHQGQKVRSNHNGVPRKLIDNLLDLFKVTGRSTTNGVKMQTISKEDQVKCDKDMH